MHGADMSGVARQILLLIFGVFCCSTAVIFIKGSAVHPLWLSALRLLAAGVIITPLWLRDRRTTVPLKADRFLSLLPAIFMALHMITWLYGAKLAPAAPATLIVNLAPLASPFFLFFMVGEKLRRREIVGTVFAVVGVAVLFGAELFSDVGATLGYVLCFISMLLFCVYIVLARQLRSRTSLWAYLAPLYLQSGLLCLVVALIGAPVPNPYDWDLYEITMLLGLFILPTVIGHSVLNHSMRHLRGQIVTTANTAQCIFAAVMAFFLFGEVPDLAFYLAGVCILIGILVTIFGVGILKGRPKATA